ncbi:MAG: FAD-dependent oxidoreductase [Pseudomonadota bacterium]
MPDRVDLLVIGGGITGQVAALTAARAGARVAIVDQGVGSGSGANAGSLHVQMQSRFLRLNPHLADNLESSLPLYLAAVKAWDALDTDLGGVEMTREGGLMLAESEAQMAFLRQKAERESRKGLDVDILDRDALHTIAPYLSPDIQGAEICRDEGKVNPLVANRRLRDLLASLDVAYCQERIHTIEEGAAGSLVRGERGDHAADHVVVAAAWGAGALVPALGLAIPTPPEPLHMNITEAGEYAIRHLVQHAERSITLKQFRSGQVVIGGGWPADGGSGEKTARVKLSSMAGNVALAHRIAPGIKGLRILRTWAGYNTPIDGKATIGPARPGGRVHLALPGDAGYTLGPIVGQCAAAVALGFTPPIDVAQFAPSRWREAA